MIKDYLEQLIDLGEEDLERIAYLSDPTAVNLSKNQRHRFFIKAQNCGKKMAVDLKDKYVVDNIEELINLCGGQVVEIDETPDENYALFAYFEKPNKITINKNIIDKSELLIEKHNLEELINYGILRNVLLGHELYHLLESELGKDSFVQRKHATIFKLGKLKIKSKISSLEEIAAMEFAKEILELKHSPYIYNVLMLYAFFPSKANNLAQSYLNI